MESSSLRVRSGTLGYTGNIRYTGLQGKSTGHNPPRGVSTSFSFLTGGLEGAAEALSGPVYGGDAAPCPPCPSQRLPLQGMDRGDTALLVNESEVETPFPIRQLATVNSTRDVVGRRFHPAPLRTHGGAWKPRPRSLSE
jgi:hypothetical protein